MEPLTQGILGAIAVQSFARRPDQRLAAGLGFFAGTLADLDVLIRSDTDPLLFLDYHRHFTHSLVFIPVAATLLAFALAPLVAAWRRRRGGPPVGFTTLWIWLAVAYGTHGLLDACTTYGTQLLWPFSDARVAWHVVAVVDPGLTLPALLLMTLAWRRRSPRLGRAACAWVLLWLGFGFVQRERADALLIRLASHHGQTVDRGGAKPTLFNLLLWRGVWQSGDTLHVAALRPGWFGPDLVSPVASAPAFEPAQGFDPASTLVRDVERFRKFSDDWLVALPADERPLVGDLRYSLQPDEISPLWAIRLDPSAPMHHVEYVPLRTVLPGTVPRFFAKVFGRGLAPLSPLSSPPPPGSAAAAPR